MEKPMSMSLKEWIIKKMAVNMVISEKIINAVVTHQFDSANDALNIHKSVEISGFGKFVFNVNKAKKQLEKYISQKAMYSAQLETELEPEVRRNVEMRLQTAIYNIKILKPKLHSDNEN